MANLAKIRYLDQCKWKIKFGLMILQNCIRISAVKQIKTIMIISRWVHTQSKYRSKSLHTKEVERFLSVHVIKIKDIHQWINFLLILYGNANLVGRDPKIGCIVIRNGIWSETVIYSICSVSAFGVFIFINYFRQEIL